MADRIKTVHEVYFLVRVGQMSEEDLDQWLTDNINASYCDDDDPNAYESDWDTLDDWDC